MKKRIFKHATQTGAKLLFSILALLLVLTGCNVPTPPQEEFPTGTEQPTDAPTEQPTELPTEQPTEVGTEDETNAQLSKSLGDFWEEKGGQAYPIYTFWSPQLFCDLVQEISNRTSTSFVIPLLVKAKDVPSDGTPWCARASYLFDPNLEISLWEKFCETAEYDQMYYSHIWVEGEIKIPQEDGKSKKIPFYIDINTFGLDFELYYTQYGYVFDKDTVRIEEFEPDRDWGYSIYRAFTPEKIEDEWLWPMTFFDVYCPSGLTDQEEEIFLKMIRESIVCITPQEVES